MVCLLKKAFHLGLGLAFLAVLLNAAPQWKTIGEKGDLPEDLCSIWKEGDHLITFGGFLAILGGVPRTAYSVTNYPIGNSLGCLLSLVPAEKGVQSDICLGSPYLRIRSKVRPLVYSQVKPLSLSGSSRIPRIMASGDYAGPGGEDVKVSTIYSFDPRTGGVEIVSSLRNSGKEPLRDLRYSLYVGAGTRYSFTPFHAELFPNLNFRVYPRPDHSLVWETKPPAAGSESQGVLQPGERVEVRYTAYAVSDLPAFLGKLYRAAGEKPVTTTVKWEDPSQGMVEIIVRESASGSMFFRCFTKGQNSLRIPLLPGTYAAQINFFPAVRHKAFKVQPGRENTWEFQAPSLGRIQVRLQDGRGRHIPGKVTFLGLHPTRSPYFEPENPVLSGRGWEGFKNSCYPGESGTQVSLPSGTYLVYGSRGPEYSIDKRMVEIFSEAEHPPLDLHIERVLNPKGLISIDPHLHTTWSDGAIGIEERLRSIMAEGLEVVVASDHNFVTDYGPDLRRLGFEQELAVICGNEVTVGGMVHYNTFPVAYRPQEPCNGAIDPISDSMAELFRRSRSKDPGTLIQVNHPRSGMIGYFNTYDLDPEKAASAREGFDLDFDVLEIVNGPYSHSANAESIRDWFHLLNRGYFFPLIGSSDAHGIDRNEPGYSRTYALYKGKKAVDLDTASLISALKQGRSFASNGPLLEFSVNGKATYGDTVTDKDGKVSIKIRVQRAPWVKVDTLRITVNGERFEEIPIQAKNPDWKDFTHKDKLILSGDAYLVVEAVGEQSLFPVMQRASRSGEAENATLSYAITNPVFVDVDGNGRFDPPWSKTITRHR